MPMFTNNLEQPNTDHIVKYYQAKINAYISRIELLELDLLHYEVENRNLLKEIEDLEKENNRLSLELDAIESNNFQPIKRRHNEY